jgi:protein-L-isoaspartate(D-aspartate) O-methyltransferase
MTDDRRPSALVDELRREGITDARVLAAMELVPREAFVDAPFAHAAYENTALPIACGQTISQPFVVAYMTQALDVGANDRVLEIGTGSGYQTAVLSRLCRRVYTLERHKPLHDEAKRRFEALKIDNVVARHGDGFEGWPEQAPFDRIMVTAAAADVPSVLIEQLKPGGILVAPLGSVPNADSFRLTESFSQRLTKIIRSDTGVRREALIPVVFVPMVTGLPAGARKPDGSQSSS